MKLSDLIEILSEAISINGDMDVVIMTNEEVYEDIEINCPDSELPMYIEGYKKSE